tara:strand:+ start:189 stop:488 length:300 start_codon:yes stop_codon:yes gene_type:complete
VGVPEFASRMPFFMCKTMHCEPVEQVPKEPSKSRIEKKPVSTPTAHGMGCDATHTAQHPQHTRTGRLWHQETAFMGLSGGHFGTASTPKIDGRHYIRVA